MKKLSKVVALMCLITTGAIMIPNYSSEAYSYGAGAPEKKTGSPGDQGNCSGCHGGGGANNLSTIPGIITSDIPSSGYIPGNTYTINAIVSGSGVNKFGFEISPQNTSGNLMGTLVLIDPVTTKLISSGKYITHTSDGTAATGTNSRTWTFSWIAPPAGSGNLKFYGAFLVANANNTNTGDQVRLSSLTVQENLTAGMDDIIKDDKSIIVYPNPATDRITVGSDNYRELTDVVIIDITGKLVKKIENYDLSNHQSIDISDLQRGIYILKIRSEKGIITKKVSKK